MALLNKLNNLLLVVTLGLFLMSCSPNGEVPSTTVNEVPNAAQETTLNTENHYTNAFSLSVNKADFSSEFKVYESKKITLKNVQESFNYLSENKLKYFNFESGYNLEMLKEKNPAKSINQITMLFRSSEDALTFFEDREEYYLSVNWEKKNFTAKNDFDLLNYYELIGEDVASYRFLIKKDNAIIILSVVSTKLLDNYELKEYLDSLNTQIETYSDTEVFPTEVIVPERTTFGLSPYRFDTKIVKNEMNGVVVAVTNYTFEKKGEDWGELKEVQLVIDNKNGADIYPFVMVTILDSSISSSNSPTKLVEVGEWLYSGDYMITKLTFDLSLNSITNPKTLKINVGEGYYSFKNIVNLEIPVKFS